jgi:hypothetical protein
VKTAPIQHAESIYVVFKLNLFHCEISASIPWEKDGESFHTKKKNSIPKLVACESQPFDFLQWIQCTT